jgi:Heterokaryon incompatibility protein (HET)
MKHSINSCITESTQHPFWVDAICIAQNDAKEKAQQVQNIHQVFRNASTVLIWLGPSVDNSDLVISSTPVLQSIEALYPTLTRRASLEVGCRPGLPEGIFFSSVLAYSSSPGREELELGTSLSSQGLKCAFPSARRLAIFSEDTRTGIIGYSSTRHTHIAR